MSEILSAEEENAIELFKCRGVGESFTTDDYEGRAALFKLVARLRAEVAQLTLERDAVAELLDETTFAHDAKVDELRQAEAEVARLQAALADSQDLMNLYLRTLKMLGHQLGETREASKS